MSKPVRDNFWFIRDSAESPPPPKIEEYGEYCTRIIMQNVRDYKIKERKISSQFRMRKVVKSESDYDSSSEDEGNQLVLYKKSDYHKKSKGIFFDNNSEGEIIDAENLPYTVESPKNKSIYIQNNLFMKTSK